MADAGPLVCLDDFETYASQVFPKSYLGYFRGEAERGITAADNKKAFERYLILPRMLKDVSTRDLTTTILGHRISFPICIAPTGFLGLVHHEGDKAVAKACEAIGTVFTQSIASNFSIPDVAEAAPNGLRFQQVYFTPNDSDNLALIETAERHGCQALVLTVELPVKPVRWESRRIGLELPPHLEVPHIPKAKGVKIGATGIPFKGLTWGGIQGLKSVTSLPIVLKGILTPEDARLAVQYGVDGIIVSNKGGRNLDTVPSTIDALRGIVEAVDGKCEVYIDGGFRCGTDVLKAIALGARAVFIGRPVVYGLAYNGAEGVKEVLEILKNEFSTAMALAGCRSIGDIDRSLVIHRNKYLSML